MPRRTKAQLALDEERLAGRRAESYRLYISGWTQTKIAARFEIDQSTTSEDLRIYRLSLPPADRDAIRKDHLAQLHAIRASMAELVAKEGAPVTAGKDGDIVRDPDTSQVVRDYSLRIAATDRLLKVLEREAKQLGLDEASKVEVSGQLTVVDSIDAKIAALAESLGLNDPALPSTSNADASS